MKAFFEFNYKISNEMSKLQKINGKLEKTCNDWKRKHQDCQQKLIAMHESQLLINQRNEKLESLCRALQVTNYVIQSCEVRSCDVKSPILWSDGQHRIKVQQTIIY